MSTTGFKYDPKKDKVLEEPAAPLAKQPTAALPGTPEKIEVMAERMARGEQVIHPDDAKLPDEVAFMPEIVGPDIIRGKRVLQGPEGVKKIRDQLQRSVATYSDGPQYEARMARRNAAHKSPEWKAKHAARKKAARAFQRQQHLAAEEMRQTTSARRVNGLSGRHLTESDAEVGQE